MTLAIVGSRNCKNLDAQDICVHVPPDCTAIISGGAGGVDTLAEEAAERLGLPFQAYLPQFKKYGKNATLERNREIVEKADSVLAFWDYRSRGTAHTIDLCIKMQKPVRILDLEAQGKDADLLK